jgi:predicted transcriptional regulator
MRKTKANEKLLTEVELEIMTAVWELGECTIKDVQKRLPKNRPLAYTSVATIIKILENKNVLGRNEKEHTYFPLLVRKDYESRTLRHVADRVFQGNPSSMVARLIDESDLSAEELRSLRKLLDERLKDE